jgi:O-antigen/teichoic acid export membrane protein
VGYDLVMVASGTLDRLIMIPFVAPAQLGLYAVAIGFARLVSVVHPAISTVLLSSLSRMSAIDESKRLHDRAFRFALAGLVVIVAVAVVVDRPLLALVYGTAFGEASGIFRILVVEAALGCLVAITTQTYLAWNRPGAVSVVYGASLVVFLATAALLVPRFGAHGAAFALLSGTIARLLGLLGALPLRYGMRLPRLAIDGDDLAYLRLRIKSLRRAS